MSLIPDFGGVLITHTAFVWHMRPKVEALAATDPLIAYAEVRTCDRQTEGVRDLPHEGTLYRIKFFRADHQPVKLPARHFFRIHQGVMHEHTLVTAG